MKRVLVVTGPSAIGKTYLGQFLTNEYPNLFIEAKLFTTRSSRPGEMASDRIFISEAEFVSMRDKGDFLISGKFNNSWYGYDNDSLTPKNKNIIVNAWPELIPEFTTIDRVLFVGLTSDLSNLDFLINRMYGRGDSKEKVTERLELIKKDVADIRSHRKLIEKSGRLFIVANDQSLASEVLPWIIGRLEP